MEIPCDPQIVAEMRSMIDPCEWRVLRQCFSNWLDTGRFIDWIILVSKDVALEEVAALCAEEAPEIDTFKKMCGEGMIQIGNTGHQSGVRPYTFKLSMFEDTEMFNVICIPPFYIAKRIEV